MSSDDSTLTSYDNVYLNYYNIVKVRKGLYYMYYLAFGEDTNGLDLSQRMMFAYSSDLIHWIRAIPGKTNNVILDNLADASASYNPHDIWPFRLVCRKMINGQNHLAMYKSQNGYDFEFCKNLLDGKYDTQNAVVNDVTGGGYAVFTRLWNLEHTDRMIGIAHFDVNNNMIDSLTNIGLHYVYNPACSRIDDKYILLLPSYINNLKYGGNDTMSIKSFLMTEMDVMEIDNNLKEWENSPRIYVCPGIIEHNGTKYIAYQANNSGHDAPGFPVNKYKIIKIVVKKKAIHITY